MSRGRSRLGKQRRHAGVRRTRLDMTTLASRADRNQGASHIRGLFGGNVTNSRSSAEVEGNSHPLGVHLGVVLGLATNWSQFKHMLA